MIWFTMFQPKSLNNLVEFVKPSLRWLLKTMKRLPDHEDHITVCPLATNLILRWPIIFLLGGRGISSYMWFWSRAWIWTIMFCCHLGRLTVSLTILGIVIEDTLETKEIKRRQLMLIEKDVNWIGILGRVSIFLKSYDMIIIIYGLVWGK